MTKVSKNLEVQGYRMEETTEREGYGKGKTVEREAETTQSNQSKVLGFQIYSHLRTTELTTY